MQNLLDGVTSATGATNIFVPGTGVVEIAISGYAQGSVTLQQRPLGSSATWDDVETPVPFGPGVFNIYTSSALEYQFIRSAAASGQANIWVENDPEAIVKAPVVLVDPTYTGTGETAGTSFSQPAVVFCAAGFNAGKLELEGSADGTNWVTVSNVKLPGCGTAVLRVSQRLQYRVKITEAGTTPHISFQEVEVDTATEDRLRHGGNLGELVRSHVTTAPTLFGGGSSVLAPGSGSTGGSVTSVNGQTGAVVLSFRTAAQITAEITAAIDALKAGAPANGDTLKELSDRITAEASLRIGGDTAVTQALRGGVPADGDTLKKLDDKIKAAGKTTVASVAAAYVPASTAPVSAPASPAENDVHFESHPKALVAWSRGATTWTKVWARVEGSGERTYFGTTGGAYTNATAPVSPPGTIATDDTFIEKHPNGIVAWTKTSGGWTKGFDLLSTDKKLFVVANNTARNALTRDTDDTAFVQDRGQFVRASSPTTWTTGSAQDGLLSPLSQDFTNVTNVTGLGANTRVKITNTSQTGVIVGNGGWLDKSTVVVQVINNHSAALTVTWHSSYKNHDGANLSTSEVPAGVTQFFTFHCTGSEHHLIQDRKEAKQDRTWRSVTQNAHGFVVGQPVRALTATTWEAALTAPAGKEAGGVVTKVVDANNFEVTLSGLVTATGHGFTDNNTYWLPSAAGAATATQPTSGVTQAVFTVIDANTLLVHDRQAINVAAGSTNLALHRVSVSHAGNTEINSTAATLPISDAKLTKDDPNGMVTGDTIVIKQAGMYDCLFTAVLEGLANQEAEIELKLNGTTIVTGDAQAGSSNNNANLTVVLPITRQLAVNDVLTLTKSTGEWNKANITVTQLATTTIIPATTAQISTGEANGVRWVETIIGTYKRLEMWGTIPASGASHRDFALPKPFKDANYQVSFTPFGSNGSIVPGFLLYSSTTTASNIGVLTRYTGDGSNSVGFLSEPVRFYAVGEGA